MAEERGREEVLTLPKSPAPPLESREGLNVASAFCAGLWTLERHAHKIRASPEREKWNRMNVCLLVEVPAVEEVGE